MIAVKLLYAASLAYVVAFMVCLPFVLWYKFCTRHLTPEQKPKALRSTFGNLIGFLLGGPL